MDVVQGGAGRLVPDTAVGAENPTTARRAGRLAEPARRPRAGGEEPAPACTWRARRSPRTHRPPGTPGTDIRSMACPTPAVCCGTPCRAGPRRPRGRSPPPSADAAQSVDHQVPGLGALLPGPAVQQPVGLVEGFGRPPLPLRRPGAVLVPPCLAIHRLPRRVPASFPHPAREGGRSTSLRTRRRRRWWHHHARGRGHTSVALTPAAGAAPSPGRGRAVDRADGVPVPPGDAG